MTLSQDSAHLSAQIGSTRPAEASAGDAIVFGKSEQMLALRAKLRIVAASNLPVLIQGESGTGKEVIARLLHQWSPVADLPFVHVNCAAVPKALLDSELFLKWNGNYYTGNGAPDVIQSEKERLATLANGGTLCLDEIGELEASLQAKLLQLLQHGKFGMGTSWEPTVIRIVCSTDQDLEEAVSAGAFRRDLFYRLNVVKLELPSLRERSIDVPELCDHFVRLYNDEFKCNAKPVSAELIGALQQYEWPGNIRQLANLMKRYVVLDSEEVLRIEINGKSKSKESIPEMAVEVSMPLQAASREVKRSFERQQILRALQTNQWNRKRAARALNISYRALLYKLKECRLEVPVTD